MLVGVPIGEHMVFYNLRVPNIRCLCAPGPIWFWRHWRMPTNQPEDSDFKLLHHERLSTEREGH